jgi:putative transcriptional regulator
LHSADYQGSGNSFEVNENIYLSATLDILKAVAFGPAPSQSLFALGYGGWGPGQLEAEIGGNGWLTVPFDPELLFATPLEKRYDKALASLGISRASLSATAGNA